MALRCVVRAIPSSFLDLRTRTFSTNRRILHAVSIPALHRTHPSPTNVGRYPSSLAPLVLRPAPSASFHSTPHRQGIHLIQFLAAFLKASGGLELARTAGRITLTFIPMLWFGRIREKRAIQYAAYHGIPVSEEKKKEHIRNRRWRTITLKILVLVPITLFWLTIIGSLERTPLTGRWRVILLSPDEEDEIAAHLAGPGWYKVVGDILSTEGSPRVIPTSDWRYQWVQNTLRRLEAHLPVLASEPELCPNWMERGPDDHPLPPPTEHPLRPRPRALEYLHRMCDTITTKDSENAPLVTIPGPPYSLLVVDKPDSSNAFAYGFGPDGGSGIVVYTGFLEDIMAKNPSPEEAKSTPTKHFYLAWLFGDVAQKSTQPTPTEEQTTELAILLAHEMAHLILSHHLESLSSVEVMIPGAMSIISDIIRVLIFPVTAIFGPFVNDAVAQLGKVGTGELAKLSEYCTTKHQEIEADTVSMRILAHAGFDARDVVRFWERRSGDGVECARVGKQDVQHPGNNITSATHPIGAIRVDGLRSELDRWEEERQRAIGQKGGVDKA